MCKYFENGKMAYEVKVNKLKPINIFSSFYCIFIKVSLYFIVDIVSFEI